MSSDASLNLVRQQGFPEADAATCAHQFPAIMFQPRAVAGVVLIGIVLQAWPVFMALSAVLWWNVLIPRLNPFDALYNRGVARAKGRPRLPPATGPRRFAQGMAATTTLGVAVSLFARWSILAYVFEAFVIVALTSLLLGRLCLGTYLFHVLRGELRFANRTLPWSRPPAALQ